MNFMCIGPKRFKLNNLLTLCGKYIFEDDAKPSKYRTMCDKMAVNLAQMTIICSLCIIFIHILLAIVPFYMTVFRNIRVSAITIEIPFFETDTDTGYVVNLFMQLGFGITSMVFLIIVVARGQTMN